MLNNFVGEYLVLQGDVDRQLPLGAFSRPSA